MYLSAERVAIANRAVQETFEQTSIVWQAIPHWDVGDPGQFRVRNDTTGPQNAVREDGLWPPFGGSSLELDGVSVRFALRGAQGLAPSPDALLDAVIARTVLLAEDV